VLSHHCAGHDFSRWISDVFYGRPLAAEVAAAEAGLPAHSPAPPWSRKPGWRSSPPSKFVAPAEPRCVRVGRFKSLAVPEAAGGTPLEQLAAARPVGTTRG